MLKNPPESKVVTLPNSSEMLSRLSVLNGCPYQATVCKTLQADAGQKRNHTQLCYMFGIIQRDCSEAGIGDGISHEDIMKVVDAIVDDQELNEAVKYFLRPSEDEME